MGLARTSHGPACLPRSSYHHQGAQWRTGPCEKPVRCRSPLPPSRDSDSLGGLGEVTCLPGPPFLQLKE